MKTANMDQIGSDTTDIAVSATSAVCFLSWSLRPDDFAVHCWLWTEFNGDRGTKSKPIQGRIWSMASRRLHRTRWSNRSIPKLCR
jgi:hypothetical protein